MTDWTTQDTDAARKQGWDIWTTTTSDPFQLQKLDEAELFPTDADAWEHVLKASRNGDELAQKALSFLMEKSPAEHAAIFAHADMVL